MKVVIDNELREWVVCLSGSRTTIAVCCYSCGKPIVIGPNRTRERKKSIIIFIILYSYSLTQLVIRLLLAVAAIIAGMAA